METLSRRSVLRASLGLAAAGALARPFIANAAARTATVWWVQGFIPEEDAAFRKLVADYEKASGNTIEYSIVPFAPLRQKIVSAITSGVVPDVINATPPEVVPLQAWEGRLVDVTDVVETQKSHYFPTALASANCYNRLEKRRSYYAVPIGGAVWPFHIWGSLIEKAGYKVADLPKTWDAFCDFFKPVQRGLRTKGMRHTYGMGWVVSTVGNDPTSTFQAHMIAYGGEGLVTSDGRLHADDPKVREAVKKALIRLTTDYKEGYVPPGSVNWNDADDNNAFHSKLCVMDFDGSLSTEVALYHDKEAYYHDTVTHPLPLSNEGKPLPSQFLAATAFIPQGAKNVEAGKDFLKYMIQPKINGEFLKSGLCRTLPVFPEVVKNDPWWLDPKDPHRGPYIRQGLFGPTIPFYYVYNPAYAQVRTEHPFNVAWSDIVHGGMEPEQAADKAFKRIEAIFAKYPIQQA
ncbi:MAG TPA: ABC transporter substrate-binding protein [Stellaceae bacterium]|nr:ABC transporter substrate-binding protein [Stellaceae bacterium]